MFRVYVTLLKDSAACTAEPYGLHTMDNMEITFSPTSYQWAVVQMSWHHLPSPIGD